MKEKPIKIAAIIPSAFCFGLQHFSIALLAELKHKVKVHFLVTLWNNGEFINLLNKNNFSYSLSWLGMFSRKLDGYNLRMSLHALVKLPVLYYDFIKLLRQQKPDVLLFANHHELILFLPVLAFTKIPVVCHMHDPSPAIAFQKRTFRWYGKSVRLFIAISEDVKKRLMDLGCNEKKIAVVHNGIAIPELYPATQQPSLFAKQFGWPADTFVVGITGQMTATKGHEDLLDAFAIARQQNSRLRLVIGGKKLEPLYAVLQHKIHEMGLQNFIGFSGWIDKVETFYQNIDLFILASRHDEGYGLVVAEAMAHGKPVVITNSGGAAEIVQEGLNGFIVPKLSPDILAQRIVTLSQNPDLCTRMGENARTRIKTDFDVEISANNFLISIDTALKK